MKHLTLNAFLLIACAMTTGCATSMMNGDGFRMSGSPEGLRSFADLMTGTAVVAKTAPESLPSNPHHKMRLEQEKSVLEEIRSRFMFSAEEMQGGAK